ncbi:multidrug DMT transporter permease [Microbacterium xanthum]|uniref:multidrug DMT transporter permease n=1 Tax=Microbacterium xanthum TaxID=3079794 RepID=UPI002AD3BAEA|nr:MULTISPECIES: multidrug DMT transporter permease [unclassified Microbacterium]MDZ8171542.1 multidrug DMT transporter permease [Microbacterium sp. KSW-48]MDZ8200419.1 multidrug DMT transporter permease [Microbacterium sp. SSW1-59]
MDTITSVPAVGIALAVASALALAGGNLLQGRGVRRMETRVARSGGSRVLHLVRNRWWLTGGILLGLSIALQMAALAFAPLIVVQPVGVTALVFTVLLTAWVARAAPSGAVIRAITMSTGGVALFVLVAALVSSQSAITDGQLIAVLVTLGGVLAITAAVVIAARGRLMPPLAWVILGGVYSAFVATLGKTVILRVQQILSAGRFTVDRTDVLTAACLVGIGVAGGLSVYFVQRAHAANKADVVVAGLTVIDPAVAVLLGITILGEASGAPWWAGPAFAAAGAIAVGGVFLLSRADAASTVTEAGARARA